jgi:hypothetical protein
MEIVIDFDKITIQNKNIRILKSIQAEKGKVRALRYNLDVFIELETGNNIFIEKEFVTKYSMGGEVKHE